MMRSKSEIKKFKVPKRVQDVIPIQTIYDDGMFKIGDNKYSMSFSFTDINYSAESLRDEEDILIKYVALLNSFDPYSTTKLSICKHRRNRADFEKDVLMPHRDDGLDMYREEVNAALLKANSERSSAVKERIITVSAIKKTAEEARDHFARIKLDLDRHFTELGSSVTALTTDDRLRLLHNFYRPTEDIYYHFDMADAMKKGHSFKDYICPDTMEFKPDYFKMGNIYGRVLFLKYYANTIRDVIVQDITEVCENMIFSVDIYSLPSDVARRDVENRLLGVETNISNWQRRQNQQNNFSATPPYNLEQSKTALKDVLDDMTVRDQKLMEGVVTIVHTADSKEQLDSDSDSISQVMSAHMHQCGVLRFQQLDGLQTVLPIGVKIIDTYRTLTSESVGAIIPFNACNVFQPKGIYFGINPVSKAMILADRTAIKSGNAFILGATGGGKSMQAKWEIFCRALKDDGDILIIDPQREYGQLVKALGGEIINISASSSTHINALDMPKDYGSSEDVLALKSQFLMSLCDIVSEGKISSQDRSIIDICAKKTYSDYILSGFSSPAPTLLDFQLQLLNYDNDRAKELALILELFTSGSLNTFAKPTNVDTQSHVLCYDILDLGEQLRSIGMLVVLDSILSRITANRKAGRKTFIFIDEIYLLFQHEYSAIFLSNLWKTVRKFGAFCTGITQNVDDLLQSHLARTMLSNSEFVLMLNQAATDREALAKLFNIPEQSLHYITNSPVGHGLLRIGDKLMPFVNEFSRDTMMYKLMSTKPGEEF